MHLRVCLTLGSLFKSMLFRKDFLRLLANAVIYGIAPLLCKTARYLIARITVRGNIGITYESASNINSGYTVQSRWSL